MGLAGGGVLELQHVPDLDAVARQLGLQAHAAVVPADRAHQARGRAHSRRRHGLIGALAAGTDLTTAAEEGLTGVGVAVDRGGQIRVDGSDNNNGTG